MANPNTAAQGVCTPILVQKPGRDGFCFTVDLRTGKELALKQQISFPEDE